MCVGLLLCAVACSASPSSETTETSANSNDPTPTTGETDPDTDPDTDTDTDSDSDTDTDTDTGGDDPLAECRALPAAAIAAWMEGDEAVSTASSTPERITAAGARTWELALQILRVTDPAVHPSHASSPASMALALGMSHQHWCSDRIAATVGWTEDGDALYQTLGAARSAIESRALPGDENVDPVVIALQPSAWDLGGGPPEPASPIWGGRSHSVSKEGAGALEAIREVMNCVIETESQGLLVDFIPATMPDTDTSNFDVTVAFLSAPWAVAMADAGPFEFFGEGVQPNFVPAMGGAVHDARYYADAELVAVDVPLRGGEIVVQLVMPQPGVHDSLADFVAALDGETLALVRDQATDGYVELTMPKVMIDSTTIDYYVPLAIDCEPYTLRSVLQGAALQLDEKGIKAAAAAVDEGWDSGTGPGEPLAEVALDRPFLFFVYDRPTNHVLFSGRYGGDV
jgi:hypothetical protein